MPLGKILKDEKKEQGLTSAKLADLADVAENTVINILNGRSLSPSVYNVGPLCRVLGISLDGFFNIKVKGMDQHERDRVDEDYARYKQETDHMLELHVQNAGHQDEVIVMQRELIEAQKERIRGLIHAVRLLALVLTFFVAYAMVMDMLSPDRGFFRF